MAFRSGGGVAGDAAEDLADLRAAAEQGDAGAQRNLGRLHPSGEGVPHDCIIAHKRLNLAAAQGKEFAMKLRGFAEGRMTREQIVEAQRLARKWAPKPE